VHAHVPALQNKQSLSKQYAVCAHSTLYRCLLLAPVHAVITHYFLCGLNVTQASPLPQLPSEVVSTDAYSLQIAPELSDVCDVPLDGQGFPLTISTVEAVLNYSKVLKSALTILYIAVIALACVRLSNCTCFEQHADCTSQSACYCV
jgi:hypothetical protein